MSKKRMFGVDKVGRKTIVSINSSSLSVLQECQRKGDFMFNWGIQSESSSAQDFGTRIHQALHSWYLIPSGSRDQLEMSAAWQKAAAGYSAQDERKTFATGDACLQKYAELFRDEPWEVLSYQGDPALELELESIIWDAPDLQVRLFGTIDMLVRDASGKNYVLDHKTTSALGSAFLNRWPINHQMSGYIFLANANGLPCSDAIIQGLQIVKTKQEIMRINVHRTNEQLAEFVETVVSEVKRFLLHTEHKFFPHADGFTCAGLGSPCQFFDVCSGAKSNRRAMLQAMKSEMEAKEHGSESALREASRALAESC